MELRKRGERVGVIAVDPSSPFSGGALLGDRIRMLRHSADTEVFIRSLATRGAHGGLSRSAADIVRVIEAWGASSVLLETVGVGQPSSSSWRGANGGGRGHARQAVDDVQANKAVILEAADVLVLNKADRPGADVAESGCVCRSRCRHRLRGAAGVPSRCRHVNQRAPVGGVTAPIVRSVARGGGIVEVLAQLDPTELGLSGTAAGTAQRAARERRSWLAFLRDRGQPRCSPRPRR